VAAVAIFASSGVSFVAGADDATSRATAAQALFDEARKEIAEGNAAAACPKLEESQRLDPKLGTQLNIALCYVATGRSASAWTLFREVEAAAKRVGEGPREAFARLKADALEPKLARLTIVVASGVDATTLLVTRDGVSVGAAQLSIAIPVDRGSHRIVATAPGMKPWERVVVVAEDGQRVEVAVPKLEPVGASSSIATGSAPSDAGTDVSTGSGSLRRTLGVATLGAGIVGYGFSTWFLIRAIGAHDDAHKPAASGIPHCDVTGCDDIGLTDNANATSYAHSATIFFLLGSAAVVGGATLWLTAPHATEAPRIGVSIGPRSIGVVGAF
jgi:hypothetical protein